MGLSESKVIVDVLSEACCNAQNTGRIDINAVLSKTEFVESLRQTWAYIPEKTRRSIGRRPNNKSLRRPRRRLSEANTSKIAVSQSFMANVPRWVDDSFSFFQEDKNSLDLTRSPLAESYQYLGRLDCRIKTNTVRARFIKILFPRLKDRLCLRYLRSNDRETIARIISSSGIVTSCLDDIKQNVTRLTDEGGRIDGLCRNLGSVDTCRDSHLGNLLCLPDDIHDEFIRSLELNGPVREAEIQRIKSRGILDVKDRKCLDRLAANVFNSLWMKVEASIDEIIRSSDLNSDWSLQHTRSFRMQDSSSEQVLQQPNLPVPSNEAYDGSDIISHAHSLVSPPTNATSVSPNTLRASQPASLSQEQSLGHPYHNATNQLAHSLEPSQGQPTTHIENMVSLDHAIQPLSSTHPTMPTQAFEPSDGHLTASGGSVVSLDHMIQPLSSTYATMPTQAFEPSDGHLTASGGSMVSLNHMIQPLSSIHPMMPTQSLEPPDGHTPGVFQSICCPAQELRPPHMQAMVGNENAYAPNIAETQNEQSQNDLYMQFKQFVPVM